MHGLHLLTELHATGTGLDCNNPSLVAQQPCSQLQVFHTRAVYKLSNARPQHQSMRLYIHMDTLVGKGLSHLVLPQARLSPAGQVHQCKRLALSYMSSGRRVYAFCDNIGGLHIRCCSLYTSSLFTLQTQVTLSICFKSLVYDLSLFSSAKAEWRVTY